MTWLLILIYGAVMFALGALVEYYGGKQDA